MGMVGLLSLFLLFNAESSFATISVAGVSGASSYTTTGAAVIYGGLAGTTCNGAGIDPCDNCNDTDQPTCNGNEPLCACNQRRIYNNLTVRIAIKNTETTTANALLVYGTNNSLITLNTPSNGGAFVDTTWANICLVSDLADSDCNAATGSITLATKIVIDKDSSGSYSTGDDTVDVTFRLLLPPADFDVYGITYSEGLGAFKPYPGDEKVYIEGIESDYLAYPNFSYGGKATKMRVYISSVDLTQATYKDTLQPAELPLDGTGGLTNKIVDGLENGVTYAFRFGLVDQAENVVQYFPSKTPVDLACNSAPLDVNTCRYAAAPDQVLGLLTKDLNCFVASAAYGTALEPKLETFRDFRYKILLPTTWGRAFVRSYYAYGPYAARFIQDKPWLRALTRGALWPLYGFSYLSLKMGFATAFALTLTLLIAISWSLRLGIRRAFLRG